MSSWTLDFTHTHTHTHTHTLQISGRGKVPYPNTTEADDTRDPSCKWIAVYNTLTVSCFLPLALISQQRRKKLSDIPLSSIGEYIVHQVISLLLLITSQFRWFIWVFNLTSLLTSNSARSFTSSCICCALYWSLSILRPQSGMLSL